jgi:regulatory protein
MRITRIESQKRRSGRKNIYIDGRFSMGISNETLLRLQFRTGDEITPELLSEMESTEELTTVRNAALRFLAHRARTVHEVREKLLKKKFPGKKVERVLDDLQESGLLNDRQFAGMYIRDQLASRPTGRLLLRQKLRQLGVEKQLTEEVLDETFRFLSQKDAVHRAVEKFMRTRAGRVKDPVAFRNRLAGFLARRGFSWDDITPVLKQIPEKSSEEIPE